MLNAKNGHICCVRMVIVVDIAGLGATIHLDRCRERRTLRSTRPGQARDPAFEHVHGTGSYTAGPGASERTSGASCSNPRVCSDPRRSLQCASQSCIKSREASIDTIQAIHQVNDARRRECVHAGRYTIRETQIQTLGFRTVS